MSVIIRVRYFALAIAVAVLAIGLGALGGTGDHALANGQGEVIPLFIFEPDSVSACTDHGPATFTFDGTLTVFSNTDGAGGTHTTTQVRGDVIIDAGGGNIFTGKNTRLISNQSTSGGTEVSHIAGPVHSRNDAHQTEIVQVAIHTTMVDGAPVVNFFHFNEKCVGKGTNN